MTESKRWLLPEGIEELLPPQARHLEQLRRQVVDHYQSWGYELVMPPFIEYLDSLLVGTGDDLDLQTFKLIDQKTGRLMGLRADMTPQVARIDAHRLRRATPTRLCYLGTVLHTLPDGFAGSRSPLQVGAELYGHAGIESDIEILSLMMETLAFCGITDTYLDIGHVGIFRGLAQQAGLSDAQEQQLFEALQRKAKPEIVVLLKEWKLDANASAMLGSLADLNGDAEVLSQARTVLQRASADVLEALANLERVAALARLRLPKVTLHYDLAELRGYHYHTGLVFAAFVAGQGQAIAQGGRYDGIGKAFGNARPATGFSTDLKTLVNLMPENGSALLNAIHAPAQEDVDLLQKVRELRAEGQCVICELPGQSGDARAMGCDRRLVKKDGRWEIQPL